MKTPNKPGYLAKILLCTAMVILIQLLKKYVDSIFPGSILFYHFLFTTLQVLVLFWTIISLIIPFSAFIKKALVLIAMLAIPEILFTYWLHHPWQIPSSFHNAFMRYSTQAQNDIIQFCPESSAYNDSLFYTLEPSSRFVFSNPEFSDSFYCNKMGLRDDDNSLQKPEIICLGDSYAMGWGVGQDETFAEQVSSLSQKKLLNAAISSYGTARELKNLYRLDTSNLRYIILQYCRNDYEENKAFVENNFSLPVSSKRKYDSILDGHYLNRYWFPGKRFVTIAKFYAEKKTDPFLFPQRITWADSADFHLQKAAVYFTDILKHSAINFKKVKVYVVDMNVQGIMDNDFLDYVDSLMKMPAYKDHFSNNLMLVPVADLLTAEDYYILDGHIRSSGHRKVAERLISYMFPQN